MGNFKYRGVALSSKDWRMKKLRGNDFGELYTADSQCLAILPAVRIPY
jgi:hypothetical protein